MCTLRKYLSVYGNSGGKENNKIRKPFRFPSCPKGIALEKRGRNNNVISFKKRGERAVVRRRGIGANSEFRLFAIKLPQPNGL